MFGAKRALATTDNGLDLSLQASGLSLPAQIQALYDRESKAVEQWLRNTKAIEESFEIAGLQKQFQDYMLERLAEFKEHQRAATAQQVALLLTEHRLREMQRLGQ